MFMRFLGRQKNSHYLLIKLLQGSVFGFFAFSQTNFKKTLDTYTETV